MQQTIDDGHGHIVDIDTKYGGGVTVPEAGGHATIYITGHSVRGISDESGQTMTHLAYDILAHEFVGHGIPRTVGTDTGNAVTNENKVLREAGMSLRAPEPSHVEW